jgi:glycerol-3-phosphate O-acyltransferase 3/4
MWYIFAFALVGMVPHQRLRRKMNDAASLIGNRIIARSVSAVMTFHNEQYKPKSGGFCVANHTTPIDVNILSSDCVYSLVRLR